MSDRQQVKTGPEGLPLLEIQRAIAHVRKLRASAFVNLTADEAQALVDEIARLRDALRQIEQPPSGTWRDLYERARRIAGEALHG